jgi:hypothetical protein
MKVKNPKCKYECKQFIKYKFTIQLVLYCFERTFGSELPNLKKKSKNTNYSILADRFLLLIQSQFLVLYLDFSGDSIVFNSATLPTLP